MYPRQRYIFSHRHRVYQRLRPARQQGEQIMLETILLLIVTLGLLIYLVYALLQPEKF
jgi:K+-transporting ATPase KdpF subunit